MPGIAIINIIDFAGPSYDDIRNKNDGLKLKSDDEIISDFSMIR